jgi:tRNA(adenine34) deaminase
MREALALADRAIELGEAPIACVIADIDRQLIVGRGFNSRNALRDRIAHAEIVAFRDAAGRYDVDEARLILVSTLEPCIMCLSACVEAAVEEVIWAYPAPLDAGAPRVEKPSSPEAKWPRIVTNVLKDDSRNRFERWLELHPEPGKQRDYIESLLAVT